jgi:hypothetical protein
MAGYLILRNGSMRDLIIIPVVLVLICFNSPGHGGLQCNSRARCAIDSVGKPVLGVCRQAVFAGAESGQVRPGRRPAYKGSFEKGPRIRDVTSGSERTRRDLERKLRSIDNSLKDIRRSRQRLRDIKRIYPSRP